MKQYLKEAIENAENARLKAEVWWQQERLQEQAEQIADLRATMEYIRRQAGPSHNESIRSGTIRPGRANRYPELVYPNLRATPRQTPPNIPTPVETVKKP